MIKHYIKIAWRNLVKNKVYSFINIFGLTVSLTSFLLIALYIFDELTFDDFHKNADNIYRVVESKKTGSDQERKAATTGYQVSAKAKAVLPGIKDAVRLATFGRANIYNTENTNVFYERFTIGNQAFLTTFDFKLSEGDRNTALSLPHSVIVTEETATKLFGTTKVVGKLIKVDRDSMPFTITAVLKNFPVNSHLSFNILFSEPTNDDYKNFVNADWNSGAFATYLLVNSKSDVRKIETKINDLVSANNPEEIDGKSSFILQPLKNIHFHSGDIEGDSGKKGSLMYIYAFVIIGLFVLLIACINYMNLTTARFANRAKEIGVRKVNGATRKNLISQFLGEAFLITSIALLLALIITAALLPAFNTFTEKQLTLGIHTDSRLWISIFLIIIVVGLLSGIYPALFQSHLKPFQLFKKASAGKGNLSIRRSLVVFQFALSIIMIIATLVVYMQMKYVNTKDMGFNKEQLVVVDINSAKVRSAAETIKTSFSKLAGVKDVSVSSRVPGEWKDIPKIKVKNDKIQHAGGDDMFFLGIDDSFIKTYQVSLTKGRNFFTGSVADSSSVIINETAAKALGISEPSEQPITINADAPFVARVVGIVKDFNFQSLRETMQPMILGFQNNPVQSIDYFTIKLNTANTAATLKQMDAILHSIDQKHLLEYHFLDKQWDLFYREDKIREQLFIIVALLTIIIACLGLFGLATYAAEQRIKEIGIRKVLGASVSSIVSMLSKDFIKLVLIAAVIAFPIAWWAMNKWLNDFAYRITVSWWVFVGAGIMAILIALLTISFQAVRAAVANPVKSLRAE